MNKLGLVSPWVDYYRKLEALFAEDPGVKVLLDNKNVAVKILVEDADKAAALETLLPNEVTWFLPILSFPQARLILLQRLLKAMMQLQACSPLTASSPTR